MRRLLPILLLAMTMPVSADVLITEIMYNPASPEGRWPDRNNPDDKGEPTRTEWVEVHNAGDDPVDVSGWCLGDEDGQTEGLPKGTVLQPGQTVVLIPSDCSVAEFRAAWGADIVAYPLKQWAQGGMNNLANGPSETNEVLELRNAKGEMVDQVNYDDEGDWPTDRPAGPSIYLTAGAFDPIGNDAGGNWARSEVGVEGARAVKQTKHFTGNDVGSPGVVPKKPVTDPEPKPMPSEQEADG